MNVFKGISIVGAGNVAWHLSTCFFRSGIKINSIINRTLQHAKELADEVNATYSTDFSNIPPETDIVFLCITDNVVSEVSQAISNKSFNIVHTSGSLPLSALGSDSRNTGVFYPFQTFSKQVSLGELKFPICIEAENDEFRNLLSSYANKISDKVVFLDSFQRMQLHLGGVMINNFSNHLIARAFDFVNNHNIDTDLLLPILEETVDKIKTNEPKAVQTGPAIRGNKEIIKKHLDLLRNHTSLYNIYEVMSLSIEAYYSKDSK